MRASKDDVDVADADIRDNNLVLFGDPASNALLGRIQDDLPIRWSGDKIRVGSKTYGASNHTLALIYPNPLNPDRYVVVNTGHTFGEAEFRGTNALLFPRWGDYAILQLKKDEEPEVVEAGFFDESWRLIDDE